MIIRNIEKEIKSKIGSGKTIVIYGPRQSGKTTLLESIFGDQDNVLWLNGDDQSTQELLAYASKDAYMPIVSGYDVVVIDEAQRIENIGMKLKILHDNFGKDVQFVATGSSSFGLANKINEPMTGRKWTFFLPPLSVSELISHFGYTTEYANLRNRLLYGSYPAVVTNLPEAERVVTELANENLYKDILNLGDIIKTDKLKTILQALAYQIGNQVSLNELASLVELDRKTVDKYISLLEQAFIIFRLPSYSRNIRNELKSSQKIYFYDVGIRNALINSFQAVDFRNDVGALFENYIVAELKKQEQNGNFFFWRNTEQQEVDFLNVHGDNILAMEIKWSEKKVAKLPKIFTDTYAPDQVTFLNRENYLQFFSKRDN